MLSTQNFILKTILFVFLPVDSPLYSSYWLWLFPVKVLFFVDNWKTKIWSDLSINGDTWWIREKRKHFLVFYHTQIWLWLLRSLSLIEIRDNYIFLSALSLFYVVMSVCMLFDGTRNPSLNFVSKLNFRFILSKDLIFRTISLH